MNRIRNFVIFSIFTIFSMTQLMYYLVYSTKAPGKRSFKPACTLFTKEKNIQIRLDGVDYPQVIPLYENRSIDMTCLNHLSNQTRPKTILMWNKFYGLPLISYQFGVRTPFSSLNCPIVNCELTNNRSKLNESQLVLFHLRNKIDHFPERTHLNQRFVHVIYESPVHCHLCTQFENQFNLSATYTSESDYTSLYLTDSGFYWNLTNLTQLESNLKSDVYSTKDKDHIVAALISNCNSMNQRDEYIKELSRFVNVTIYGRCGSKCPQSIDCKEMIGKKYKFYLAFENSICRDYITEKFFNMLRYDIIPVVFGAGNYSLYVPRSAYINAMDFETPKHLADYLLNLNQNHTVYNKYFEWKKYIGYRRSNEIVKGGYLCEMCIQLHLEEQTNALKHKELTQLNKTFGMKENCYGIQTKVYKQFNYVKGANLAHSFFMNPE
jgi:alpha-1,3-fucosyltransferase